jgi:hypothetical protein
MLFYLVFPFFLQFSKIHLGELDGLWDDIDIMDRVTDCAGRNVETS